VASIGDWNRVLADTLLPADVNASEPVVLACDDETIRLAGERLALSDREALPDLLAACRERSLFVHGQGFWPLRVDVEAFRAAARPRPVPPWLYALALAVLAASRMDRDEAHATHAYYARLLGLLDLQPEEHHPPVSGFTVLEPLWVELADWLANDEDGQRGLLQLPDRFAHRHVGPPIAQTLFRARDRVVLSAFFARHRANLDAGWDILLALRHWGGRHALTRHARELIETATFAPLARSALRAAYATWDGSLPEEGGRRSWPGRLRLAVSPRRVGLYLASERHQGGATLEGPVGVFALPPWPGEVELPLGWLDRFATGRLVLAVQGSTEAVAVPGGPVLLFELQAEGLIHVAAAREELVWLLTREVAFHAPEFDDCRTPSDLLPAGWTLLAAVDPARLPADLRELERVDRPDLELTGGLRLGERTYLAGYAPMLVAGAIEEPLPVTVDGEPVGEIGPYDRLELLGLGLGEHTVDADVVRFAFELAGRGVRAGIGELRWDLGDPPLYRNGATPPGRGGRDGVGPWVHGAVLNGVVRPSAPRPLLLRTNAPVFVLHRDGSVQACSRPQPQGWQRQVGLDQPGLVWAVPDGEDAEWVAVAGAAPRMLRVGSGAVAMSDAISDVVSRYADAPVLALHGDPEAAQRDFQALLERCAVQA
jgi:hypothetical protein